MDQAKPLSDFIAGIANDLALFTAIYHLWLQAECANPVWVFSHTVMPIAKISARGTYTKTINELSDYGYLEYRPSKKKAGSRVYLKS
jgi:hypothetical protein